MHKRRKTTIKMMIRITPKTTPRIKPNPSPHSLTARDAQDQQQQPQPGQPNAGPKTPEQILEDAPQTAAVRRSHRYLLRSSSRRSRRRRSSLVLSGHPTETLFRIDYTR